MKRAKFLKADGSEVVVAIKRAVSHLNRDGVSFSLIGMDEDGTQIYKQLDVNDVYKEKSEMNDELRGLNTNKVVTTEWTETLDGSPSQVKDVNGFIAIKFQAGPVKEKGVNGTTIENVIQVLIDRLEGFQKGTFKSRHNALAITALEDAQNWLERRTRDRVARGVEGINAR